jgi:hypothetical protein
MEKISVIAFNNRTYHLTEDVIMHLYPWLNNYLLIHKVKERAGIFFIADDNLARLIEEFTCSLRALLKSGYTEPILDEFQKYPTRYEKILFDDHVYRVNYRMSSYGHSVYFIHCILNDLIISAYNNLTVRLY